MTDPDGTEIKKSETLERNKTLLLEILTRAHGLGILLENPAPQPQPLPQAGAESLQDTLLHCALCVHVLPPLHGIFNEPLYSVVLHYRSHFLIIQSWD